MDSEPDAICLKSCHFPTHWDMVVKKNGVAIQESWLSIVIPLAKYQLFPFF